MALMYRAGIPQRTASLVELLLGDSNHPGWLDKALATIHAGTAIDAQPSYLDPTGVDALLRSQSTFALQPRRGESPGWNARPLRDRH